MVWYTQDKRTGALKTPLGQDKMVLTWFEGTEGLSELFQFRVEALHEQANVNFDPVLGQNCTVSLETLKHGKRYFVGVLAHARLLRETQEGFLHELVLRPWLWLLSHRVNSRIFHEKTPLQIIQLIFNDHSAYAKFEDRTGNRDYPTLEYCVQHNESDLDFVCRLMEAHGIAYRFKFEDDKQTLVLCDGTSSYDPIPGDSRKFFDDEMYHQRDEEHFFSWTPARQFTSGKATVNDYDLHNPRTKLEAEKSPTPSVNFNPGELEDYTHPYNSAVNHGITQNNGNAYALARIDMRRSADGRYYASGDAVSAAPGLTVQVQNTFKNLFDKKYLVLQTRYRYGIQTYRSSGKDTGAKEIFQVNCVLLEDGKPFAPPMVTRKPLISGPQTGKVVTKSPGQDLEIDCDSLGRIWVHFHWDRAKEDEDPNARTMPCRVAQVWAGNKWGGMFIPRVGMEVLVHFIDGDPDRPIVVGTVYNGDEGAGNMPPYDLPGQKNIAGWKSQSTPKATGYNEFVMDDTAGKELMRMHAQYDKESTIENDQRTKIKNNEKRDVDVDRTSTVGNNDKLDVGNELTVTAKTKITLKVGASSIVIDNTSITIQTGSLTTKGTLMADHEAGGVMTIKGATVAIN